MSASLRIEDEADSRTLVLQGRLDTGAVAPLWLQAVASGRAARGRRLILNLAGVSACDTAGAILLLAVERAHGGDVTMTGASAELARVLDLVRAAARPPPPRAPPPPATWGDVFRLGLEHAGAGFAFVGEAAVAALRLARRPRAFRAADVLALADHAGVRAMPLVLLLGLLMGVILAFQSLLPMRRFGAEIYVANLVAISLLRELGPLLASVIVAGRTGSAFAAEIGTMKVNQEIDALQTMGVDSMTFLVLPRMTAAMLVMPALALAMDVAGLLGMLLVMVGAGFPPVAIANQVRAWVVPRDLWGGLFKAVLFGATVAGIGCRAGLATGAGPRAVGLAATSAVVGGIVATIALDGVCAVLFFRLGL
jgi:phospholipid/cholesterol/gamma-HCH transport system permease protein